jgi:hypothetical protein
VLLIEFRKGKAQITMPDGQLQRNGLVSARYVPGEGGRMPSLKSPLPVKKSDRNMRVSGSTWFVDTFNAAQYQLAQEGDWLCQQVNQGLLVEPYMDVSDMSLQFINATSATHIICLLKKLMPIINNQLGVVAKPHIT